MKLDRMESIRLIGLIGLSREGGGGGGGSFHYFTLTFKTVGSAVRVVFSELF